LLSLPLFFSFACVWDILVVDTPSSAHIDRHIEGPLLCSLNTISDSPLSFGSGSSLRLFIKHIDQIDHINHINDPLNVH
jgi:hypothetical protein